MIVVSCCWPRCCWDMPEMAGSVCSLFCLPADSHVTIYIERKQMRAVLFVRLCHVLSRSTNMFMLISTLFVTCNASVKWLRPPIRTTQFDKILSTFLLTTHLNQVKLLTAKSANNLAQTKVSTPVSLPCSNSQTTPETAQLSTRVNFNWIPADVDFRRNATRRCVHWPDAKMIHQLFISGIDWGVD